MSRATVRAEPAEGSRRDADCVELRVVEQVCRDARAEDPGDPREDDERQKRLLPSLRVLVVVAQRREDGRRGLEHKKRAKHPGAVAGRFRTCGRAHFVLGYLCRRTSLSGYVFEAKGTL